MTKDERLIDEYNLRRNQLRNINRVMNSGMPKSKMKHFEDNILPGYITRELNARHKAAKALEHLSKQTMGTTAHGTI